MDSKTEEQINKASGRLIMESGMEGFSLEKLSKQPEIIGFDLYALIRKKEEAFEKLLFALERELKELINGISSSQNSPADEFEKLFKQLHRLFKQKPYYLTVIFDKDLRQLYSGADNIISRIKSMAEKYLTGLIDRGKAQKVFTLKTETKVLVEIILGSFQALMNNMQLADNMVRDLKKNQSVTD